MGTHRCHKQPEKFLRLFSFLTIFLVLPGLVLAQQPETESELPALEKKAKESTEAAAQKAKSEKILEGEDYVTFEQVFARPDDIDLNFRYAQIQIKKGELLGAASTLERILLIDPNRAKVRLLHAVVLYRLDNLQEAEVEFTSIKDLPMPESLRQEVHHYLKKIKLRKRRTKFSIRQSVAFEVDTNRNAAPSSKQRLFANVALPVPERSTRHRDSAFLNITTVDLSHELPFQAGHEIFGSFTYYLGEQHDEDQLDLSAYQQEYGVRLKTKYFDFTPSFFVHNILVSRETFMRSQGGSLRFDTRFSEKLEAYTTGRLARQEFVDITENLAAHEREGDQIDATIGLRYALFNSVSFFTEYARIDKNAKEEYNAYTGNVVTFGNTLILGKGQFLLTALDLAKNSYEAPDLAIAGRHRREKTIRVRTTYGAPLGFFFGKFAFGPLRDVVWTFTYEYYRAHANITNYSYKNNKIQSMLSKRFEF